MCGEHGLMCGHGDSPPDLLVSSKLTKLLDMVVRVTKVHSDLEELEQHFLK